MTNLVSSDEVSVLLRLIIAHLIADFYMQRGSWVQSKIEKNLSSPYLWLHSFIAAVASWIVLWSWAGWWVFAITFITHLLIDAWKIASSNKLMANAALDTPTKAAKDSTLFIVDQLFHFVVILFLWLWYINGVNRFANYTVQVLPNSHFLLWATGYLIVLQPTGYLIGFMTKRWLPELNMKDSLKDAGTWIGLLERTIVITLIYANQFSAIGFLIAAKSILRVTDKPERGIDADAMPFSSRKHTEYVLIGTFLSFGFALITGIFIVFLMRL